MGGNLRELGNDDHDYFSFGWRVCLIDERGDRFSVRPVKGAVPVRSSIAASQILEGNIFVFLEIFSEIPMP
jgi:hypothetical protein